MAYTEIATQTMYQQLQMTQTALEVLQGKQFDPNFNPFIRTFDTDEEAQEYIRQLNVSRQSR